MTTKTLLQLAQLMLMTAALGCATAPTSSPPTASDNERTARNSVRLVSASLPPNTMILAPGDNVKIRSSDKRRYLCNDGNPLICDRIGMNAYCYCTGRWERR